MEVTMTILRRIDRLFTPSPYGPGFAGPRHTARLMVPPGDFSATNPFFLMADDRTDVGGEFGEAHPHAGLETVTFMLSGSFEDNEGRLDPGDVEWMTSGRGIVHGKDTVTSDDMRLFQLWIALPEDQRQSSPRVQRLRKRNMPVRKEPGAEARVYSGKSSDAVARTANAAPVTLVDLRLEPNASFEQELPASYSGFVVVIEGAVGAGDPARALAKDQIGWLDRPAAGGESALRLRAADAPARVLIYAGEPQEMRLAARGPFIAGSEAELAGYFAAYRRGEFPLASSLRQEVG
jgi:redox-sensitive bicupin YhaK (pirin superfamily)